MQRDDSNNKPTNYISSFYNEIKNTQDNFQKFIQHYEEYNLDDGNLSLRGILQTNQNPYILLKFYKKKIESEQSINNFTEKEKKRLEIIYRAYEKKTQSFLTRKKPLSEININDYQNAVDFFLSQVMENLGILSEGNIKNRAQLTPGQIDLLGAKLALKLNNHAQKLVPDQLSEEEQDKHIGQLEGKLNEFKNFHALRYPEYSTMEKYKIASDSGFFKRIGELVSFAYSQYPLWKAIGLTLVIPVFPLALPLTLIFTQDFTNRANGALYQLNLIESVESIIKNYHNAKNAKIELKLKENIEDNNLEDKKEIQAKKEAKPRIIPSLMRLFTGSSMPSADEENLNREIIGGQNSYKL